MTNRKIDELVAEKVMDWKWCEIGDFKRKIFVPSETDRRRDWTAMWDENGIPHWLPNYSTSITDAWEVVELMECKGILTHISRLTEGDRFGWGVDMCKSTLNCVEEFAPTAPMAICKAALKAVGVEIE